jgi:hypothetical protein
MVHPWLALDLGCPFQESDGIGQSTAVGQHPGLDDAPFLDQLRRRRRSTEFEPQILGPMPVLEGPMAVGPDRMLLNRLGQLVKSLEITYGDSPSTKPVVSKAEELMNLGHVRSQSTDGQEEALGLGEPLGFEGPGGIGQPGSQLGPRGLPHRSHVDVVDIDRAPSTSSLGPARTGPCVRPGSPLAVVDPLNHKLLVVRLLRAGLGAVVAAAVIRWWRNTLATGLLRPASTVSDPAITGPCIGFAALPTPGIGPSTP